jgi:prepilin-type processing-associated H-X9-DG protein
MPISYTDIDPTTGARDLNSPKRYRSPGLLAVHNNISLTAGAGNYDSAGKYVPANITKRTPRNIAGVTDGLSNTMALIEDAGKNHESLSPFMLANYFDDCAACVDRSPTNRRNNYRWAEPDNGNGVSGPHQSTTSTQAKINNNASPIGGPTTCPWAKNNCGPNDEPFSFHTGGVNAVFGDGHVQFIRDSISPQTLRALCTPDQGEIVSLD